MCLKAVNITKGMMRYQLAGNHYASYYFLRLRDCHLFQKPQLRSGAVGWQSVNEVSVL